MCRRYVTFYYTWRKRQETAAFGLKDNLCMERNIMNLHNLKRKVKGTFPFMIFATLHIL